MPEVRRQGSAAKVADATDTDSAHSGPAIARVTACFLINLAQGRAS